MVSEGRSVMRNFMFLYSISQGAGRMSLDLMLLLISGLDHRGMKKLALLPRALFLRSCPTNYNLRFKYTALEVVT